jgi:tetratricopeptide (TPR) repeat protein
MRDFGAAMAAGPLHPLAPGNGVGRGDPLQRATLALNSQRPQDAERIAQDLLETDPRHHKALHILGCALLMQGRAADAIAPLESAARSLHDAEVDTVLAVALRQAGRPEEALSRVKRAVKRQSSFAPAFLELGRLLALLKRYDEAVEALRHGLGIAPMMPELSIQLGHVFLRLRNCAEAKAAFAGALDISPTSSEALLGLARSHKEIGENAPAAEYYRRYLRMKPDDAATWLNLGHCLLELGERDAGYDCFRAGARGDPKRYGRAMNSLTASGRGRFWLKPSAAARFLRGPKG